MTGARDLAIFLTILVGISSTPTDVVLDRPEMCFLMLSRSVHLKENSSWASPVQCCNEASKIFVLRRFLAEDPSLSSSSVHFQLAKNLRSFEDFRPKIPKIFGEKSPFVVEIWKKNWPTMGRFFGWKLRKHIDIPNFYRGQYHPTIFHDTYFSDCIFSFIFWQKSSILRISSKKFLSSKIFQNSEESSSSSSLFFLNPKILRLRLRSIFNLRCNTVAE